MHAEKLRKEKQEFEKAAMDMVRAAVLPVVSLSGCLREERGIFESYPFSVPFFTFK